MRKPEHWFYELRRALLILLAGGSLGWLFGYPWLGGLIALAFVMLFWTWQLRKIQNWLDNPLSDPPDAPGIWGVIFDNIYLLQRRSREANSRLESALAYLQDSLASMRDAALIIDVRGNIAWSNTSALRLLGVKFPNDRGQPVMNLIRFPKFHDYFEGENYTQPMRLPPSKEGERCLQFEVSRFGEGDRLLFVRDVTENYKLEQMRQDFVGNVSHELRTPLTVIKGYIETLVDIGGVSGTRLEKPLRQMGEQVQRMETLLRDLLWLSRIESVESLSKTEAVDMAALITEVVSELRMGYADRVIALTAASERRVLGDQQELRSAVSNLIINALKYSDAEQPVSVELYDDQDTVVFVVKDCGVGIEAIHLPRLTERFYRVDKSRSQRIGGTGLGLAIVKHVASSHEAELKIESEVGRGSTFSMVFPVLDGIA